MTPLEALAVLLAGVGAGTINAAVGSGTLITFPVLLAVGYPPLLAAVSNNVGLVPGSMAAAFGYRRELAGQWPRTLRLAIASVVNAILGALALLVLPDDAFRAIVPAFIAGARACRDPAAPVAAAGRGASGDRGSVGCAPPPRPSG